MTLKRIIVIGTVASGVLGSALPAQSVASADSWLRMTDVKRTNGWLYSENAAGLGTLRVKQVSEVAASANAGWGDLYNYYDSDKEHALGVNAASYYRLSDKVVVSGAVEYLNRSLNHATGSYFIDPTQTPFDLVEFTTENAGDKNYEKYRVAGGVGADLTRRISLGASLDYTAANYAKRKDLRHTNSLLDMTVTAGAAFHLSERLTVGANYAYRRRNESLLLSIYGKTDKVYTSLLNYGAFFGKRETFGEVGYTKENESKPLFDEYHGGAVQAAWQITSELTFFSELGYRVRNGYYGDPSPSTVVYAEHSGSQGHYTGVLNYRAGQNRHTLQLGAERDEVENLENIYSYENEETGRNYVNYLGTREVGTRTENSFSLLYTGSWKIRQELPRWQLSVGGQYDSREVKASNFPDYRRQKLSWWQAEAMLERNIRSKQSVYTLLLGGCYGTGSGEPYRDGKYASTGESETLTRTLDGLLMREYEYLTAAQVGLKAGFCYTRTLGKKGLKGYVSLDYAWQKALDTEYVGDAQRHNLALQVGCRF
ncbi:MAG: hypothetical protein IJ494_02330 [Bacteroides sp.]|nr:hypothetical protein [Bacteroides sp.]